MTEMDEDISMDMPFPGGEAVPEPAVPELAAAEPAVELVDGQWQAGQWNELPQLTCVHCKWDTLEGIEAARAYRAKCPRCGPSQGASPSPESGLLIADRWGNPVKREG